MIDESRDSDERVEMRKVVAHSISDRLIELLEESFVVKEDVEERNGNVTLTVSYRNENCRMNVIADDNDTIFKMEKNIITNRIQKYLEKNGYTVDDNLRIQLFSDKISINFWTYFKNIETDFSVFCNNKLSDLDWNEDFIQSYAINVSSKKMDVEIKNLPSHKGIVIKTYNDVPFYFKEQTLVKNALVDFLNTLEHFTDVTFSFKHDKYKMFAKVE